MVCSVMTKPAERVLVAPALLTLGLAAYCNPLVGA
jgi:hypothetical protein